MENAVQAELLAKAINGKILRLAGCSALLSGLLLLVAFFVPDKELSQGIIFSLSPLLLLPVIPVLHRLFCQKEYDLSRMALIAGLAGMAPILIELGVTRILQWTGINLLNPGLAANIRSLLAGFTILVGLWIAMTGHIGYTAKIFPVGLSVAAIIAGAVRMLIIGNLVLGSFSSFIKIALSDLWNLGLLLWIASHIVWTSWLGIWLLSHKRDDLLFKRPVHRTTDPTRSDPS